jgi:hypothetical protein
MMGNKQVLQQIKALRPGDLVRVDWHDASIGKSLSGGYGGIDIPVYSIGVFIGLLGENDKHIILGQNHFRYADGVFDIDYTAIPLVWGVNVKVIQVGYISPEEAQELLNSFLLGGRRIVSKRSRQEHLRNHHDRLG